MEIKIIKKLKLYGFNNLTKTLSFNMYDICYAKTPQHCDDYIAYIDAEYNAERLTNILMEVAQMIGANILNIARQDYEPQGASVTMLISEGKTKTFAELPILTSCNQMLWWLTLTRATSLFIPIRKVILTRESVPFGPTLMSPLVVKFPLLKLSTI